jgi:hypothetical protein
MNRIKCHCCALPLLFASIAPVYSATPTKATLLWSLDLAHDRNFTTRLQQSPHVLRPPQVEFLNEQQIIVSFDDGVISDPEPVLKPFGFHVLEVSVDSGKPGKALFFPVLIDSAQTKVIKGGKFLVLAGEQLQVFSRDFTKLASFPTPLKRHGKPTKQVFPGGRTYWNLRYERWQMDVAPGGDTVLLGHTQAPMQMQLQWLRSGDLSPYKTYSTNTWKDVFASDDGALLIQPKTTVFLSGDRLLPVCNLCMAHFITDDLIFVNTDKSFEIRSLDGDVKAYGKLSVYADPFERAQVASRIAYATGAYSGYGFPLVNHFTSVHSDVRIYDWKETRQVAEVRLSKQVESDSVGFKQLAIALSPDGKKLIILDDSKLSCYLLP